MRATPPPVALPVAAAAIPLVVAVLVPLAVPSTALAERWLRPVPGEVARSFDYSAATPFVRGAHRGVDFAAAPGTPVRAACGGRVVHAGPVAGGEGVVSIRCGTRRVSHLPLGDIAVRRGAAIRRGTHIGTLTGGHGGLHLGVRREGDPFAYEDPLALLAPLGPGPAPAAPTPRRPAPPRLAPAPPRLAPAPPRLAPAPPRQTAAPPRSALAAPRLAPAPAPPRPAPAAPPRPSPSMPPLPSAGARAAAPPPAREPRRTPQDPRTLAPWPVWVGLALLLSGAAGSSTIVVRRRRRATPRPLATATHSAR